MTTTTDAPAYLDWSRHKVNATPKPCRICGGNAHMTDERGRACHKTCAEQELVRKGDYYGGGAS